MLRIIIYFYIQTNLFSLNHVDEVIFCMLIINVWEDLVTKNDAILIDHTVNDLRTVFLSFVGPFALHQCYAH